MFEAVLDGTAEPDDAFDYYLNWILPGVGDHRALRAPRREDTHTRRNGA